MLGSAPPRRVLPRVVLSGSAGKPRCRTAPMGPSGRGQAALRSGAPLQSGLTRKAKKQMLSSPFPLQWRSCGRMTRGEDESAFLEEKCFTISFPLFRSPLRAAAIKRHCGAARGSKGCSQESTPWSGFGGETPCRTQLTTKWGVAPRHKSPPTLSGAPVTRHCEACCLIIKGNRRVRFDASQMR